MKFSVATYNIHKGFSHSRGGWSSTSSGAAARAVRRHPVPAGSAGRPSPARRPLSRLAGQAAARVHRRHDVARGRVRQATRCTATATTATRCCRAIPIVAQENADISAHAFESRGLLHCEVKLGERAPVLHCLNVHLGLFERGRQWQIRALVDRIRETVPRDAPMVIAGDFNDWRRKADRTLTDELGVVRGVRGGEGRPARTFPVGACRCSASTASTRAASTSSTPASTTRFPTGRMSDHAALAATFEVRASA